MNRPKNGRMTSCRPIVPITYQLRNNDREIAMPERLEKVIGSILGVPVETLSDDSSSDNTPGWDSLRQLSILLALENAYGISISTNEAMNVNSIANIKAVLKRHGVEF
ncbi:MAG: hypothetical protein GWP14_06155 [Actinobacteria bacterium]|nr:hypothetical protein [Actinomycetota bacterium]